MKKQIWEKIPVGFIAIVAVFLLLFNQLKAAELQNNSLYIENTINIDETGGQFKVFLKADQASYVKGLRFMLNFDVNKVQIDNMQVNPVLESAWSNNQGLWQATPYLWNQKVDGSILNNTNLQHLTFVRYPEITDTKQDLGAVYGLEIIEEAILVVDYTLNNFNQGDVINIDLDHSNNIFPNDTSSFNYLTMKVFSGYNSQEIYYPTDKMVDWFRLYDGNISQQERVIKVNFSILDQFSAQKINDADFKYSLDGIEFKSTTDTGSILVWGTDYYYQIEAEDYFDLKWIFRIDEDKEIMVDSLGFINTNDNDLGIVLGEYIPGENNFYLMRKGDVIEDGEITEADLSGSGGVLTNIGAAISNRQQLLADFNGDKKVEVTDLIKILRIAQNNSSSLEPAVEGALSVSLDQSSPDTSILTANNNELEIAKFKFQAEDNDVLIKDLYLANIDDVVSDSIFTSADARIASYELVVGEEILNTRVPFNGMIHFDLIPDKYIEVAKNGSVVATIRVNLNTIDNDYETNEIITLELRDLEAETKVTSNSLMVVNGATFINKVDNYDNTWLAADDIAAEVQYIRKTQPTLAAQALSSTVLTSGTKTLYKVNIAADNKEDIEIGAIAFKMSGKVAGATIDWAVGSALVTDAGGTDTVALDSFRFYINWTDRTADGAFTITEIGATERFKITFMFTDSRDERVSKGGVSTFELRAQVIGVMDNDYITTSILEDMVAESGTFTDVSAVDPYFVWSDNAGSPHNRTTFDWFNGNEVEGLDTDSVTLEK